MIDAMPTLSSGAHDNLSGKACIMEYVSVIMGYPWTDMPECTNGMIARVCQRVNDNIDDGERWRLLEFIPRLTATSRVPDSMTEKELDDALVRWVFNTYKDRIRHPHTYQHLKLAVGTEGELVNQTCFDVVQNCIDPMDEDPDLLIGAVQGILDEYDRLCPIEEKQFTPEHYQQATDKIARLAGV